ncbi:MAG: hypothetical protein PHE29_13865, partial [Tissierellia bacterium]|nr:hypothetical protein [Tissierellia bacterium]
MKKYYILEFFKYILNIIFRIIIFPFRLIFNFFVNILKRFKFSIAFKISTSYMLLYIIVIMIVSLITSLGFFVFEIKTLENNVIYSDLSNIINKFPDYNEFQNMVDKNDITKIKIFDDKLNAVYSSGGRDRFSNNIIATIENILLKNEYVFSSTFEHNGYSYYINIYYSSEKLVNDTKSIALLVLSSGIFGLLIFAPIVSRT